MLRTLHFSFLGGYRSRAGEAADGVQDVVESTIKKRKLLSSSSGMSTCTFFATHRHQRFRNASAHGLSVELVASAARRERYFRYTNLLCRCSRFVLSYLSQAHSGLENAAKNYCHYIKTISQSISAPLDRKSLNSSYINVALFNCLLCSNYSL